MNLGFRKLDTFEPIRPRTRLLLAYVREPCSVDIWSYKVVQNPRKPELKQASLTFFREYR